jgi:hypothetical protein
MKTHLKTSRLGVRPPPRSVGSEIYTTKKATAFGLTPPQASTLLVEDCDKRSRYTEFTLFKKSLLIPLLLFASLNPIYAAERVFSTWDGFEVDKLASIWLLQRFIAPGSEVIIYPKGDIIKQGTEFDTPNSKIKRTFNRSSFESLLDHYRVTDPKLAQIGRLIHDIEINVWEKKLYRQSTEIELVFIDLLQEYQTNEVIIEKSKAYFDRLYRELPEKLESDQP